MRIGTKYSDIEITIYVQNNV